MGNEMIKLNDIRGVMEFLKQPTIKIAEALTGILASDAKDWKLSAGKIIQAAIKGNLLTQLGREMERYREEGKIKEDYLESDIKRASFKELLKFIDEEVPDEIRFRAMKSIFFSSVGGDEESLAYELMQICKQLSSGEILILKAAYDIVNSRLAPNMPGVQHITGDRHQWFSLIAQQIGHGLPSLVERHEAHLMELKLITKISIAYGTTDTSMIEPSQHFRLTPLGVRLCEFMTKYE